MLKKYAFGIETLGKKSLNLMALTPVGLSWSITIASP